ncbi:CD48 antigen [Echeneis naucrates]|uniref:CD48 antigen n=1 Tax=Echeneis naucrates TaxID=173247 RepID=UPI0011143894|nr:CD48 antigen-like [Echeneis naucrates]
MGPALLITLLPVFSVVSAEVLQEVFGYLGSNVTLSSRATPPWNFSKIEWSIFPNSTWIATYRSGRKNTERVDQFKGRLSLNTTSGDLTIHGLISQDALEYTVLLFHQSITVHKIRLKVLQRPVEPSIQMIYTKVQEGRCWVLLRCSSQDEGVDLSWELKPPSDSVYRMTGPGKQGAVLISFSNKEKTEVICTANKTTAKVSAAFTSQCGSSACPRLREGLCFLFGFIAGLLIFLIYCFKDRIGILT